MTQEWMVKALINLGFRKRDAKIYVFLALNGAQRAATTAKALRIYERKVCHILEELQNRKVISGSQDLPKQFSALPFDRLLDLIIEGSLQEARKMEQDKDDLLALWNSWIKEEDKTIGQLANVAKNYDDFK